MLLIEHAFSLTESTTVMTVVKAMAFAGTFLGGWFSDHWGLKRTLLFSFTAAGLGLMALPYAAQHLFTLILAASLAQLGTSLFSGPARLLLTSLVAPNERQEAIGWLRAANNLGQVISNLVGSLAASLGVGFLMMFDGATSLLAATVGSRWLPNTKSITPPQPQADSPNPLITHLPNETSVQPQTRASIQLTAHDRPSAIWSPGLKAQFVLTVLTTAGFSFLYELFIVGAAAQGRKLYGENGIRLFAQMMVLNTIFCTLLAIWASRRIQNPRLAFASGIFATWIGITVAIRLEWTHSAFFAAMFFVTLGEILFTAVSSYRLIQVLPAAEKKGSIYGVALTIQRLGTLLGGALAFALIVHQDLNPVWIWLAAGASFLLALFQNPAIAGKD